MSGISEPEHSASGPDYRKQRWRKKKHLEWLALVATRDIAKAASLPCNRDVHHGGCIAYWDQEAITLDRPLGSPNPPARAHSKQEDEQRDHRYKLHQRIEQPTLHGGRCNGTIHHAKPIQRRPRRRGRSRRNRVFRRGQRRARRSGILEPRVRRRLFRTQQRVGFAAGNILRKTQLGALQFHDIQRRDGRDCRRVIRRGAPIYWKVLMRSLLWETNW
jgi:hypothetical protein